jgi:type IV pilus assembly protein PilZ
MVELRRHSRVPLETEVVFIPKGATSGTVAHAKDVSVGGMFITTDKPVSFNGELVVHLTLPGQVEALVLPGVVRYVRGGGMGVQFGLLGARETHAITEYIATKQT